MKDKQERINVADLYEAAGEATKHQSNEREYLPVVMKPSMGKDILGRTSMVQIGEQQGAVNSLQKRTTTTLNQFGDISLSHNPYSLYDDIDDAGDNLPQQSQDWVENAASKSQYDEMPDEEEVYREFADYVEANLPMSQIEIESLKKTTLKEKWTLIFNQRNRSPVFPLTHYLENLRINTGYRRRSFSWGRRSMKGGVTPRAQILRKLKLDLKMSPESFLYEFQKEPNNGIQLLIVSLQEAQNDFTVGSTLRKPKQEELHKAQVEEYDCLLCLKFAARIKDSLLKILEMKGALQSIAQCVTAELVSSRVPALDILAAICNLSSGQSRVMEVFSDIRIKFNDRVHFKLLVTLLQSTDGAKSIPFMSATLRLFNQLLACVKDINGKVFLQYEFELAGLNIELLSKYALAGTSFEYADLQMEIDIFRQNFIDVEKQQTRVMEVEGRNFLLREEIKKLKGIIEDLQNGIEISCKENEREKEKANYYRVQILELKEGLHELNKTHKGKDHPEVKIANTGEFNQVSNLEPLTPNDSNNGTVPLPPDLPPMSPNCEKKSLHDNNFPSLHWTPLKQVQNTMFEGVTEEAFYENLNFKEFTDMFTLQNIDMVKSERRHRILVRQPKGIQFIELNRAKNMMVTKRKLGMTSQRIRKAINECDNKALSGENAELLLRFTPTPVERHQLKQYALDYSKLGEPEQLMFQLAQIDQIEEKLQIIIFRDGIDDVIEQMQIAMKQIDVASLSVITNDHLKQIFVMILAYGNYMNSGKKNHAHGFKINSLARLKEVRAKDGKTTLLEFLVETIMEKHNKLMQFHEDLELEAASNISYLSLMDDLNNLKHGLDLTKAKVTTDPSNKYLTEFYSIALEKMKALEIQFRNMSGVYGNVCRLFGENINSTEPKQLFKTLYNFIIDFKEAEGIINQRRSKATDLNCKASDPKSCYQTRQHLKPTSNNSKPAYQVEKLASIPKSNNTNAKVMPKNNLPGKNPSALPSIPFKVNKKSTSIPNGDGVTLSSILTKNKSDGQTTNTSVLRSKFDKKEQSGHTVFDSTKSRLKRQAPQAPISKTDQPIAPPRMHRSNTKESYKDSNKSSFVCDQKEVKVDRSEFDSLQTENPADVDSALNILNSAIETGDSENEYM